jgi:hypothetical protein
VGFDVLTTCQPSTVWCSRETLPAAAAQPAKARQSCSATDYYYYYYYVERSGHQSDLRDICPHAPLLFQEPTSSLSEPNGGVLAGRFITDRQVVV